jgi:hypothetical protein
MESRADVRPAEITVCGRKKRVVAAANVRAARQSKFINPIVVADPTKRHTKTREQLAAELAELKNQHDYVRVMCREVFGCDVADAPVPAGTFEYWQARYCGWDVLAARAPHQRIPPLVPQYPTTAEVAEQILTRTAVVRRPFDPDDESDNRPIKFPVRFPGEFVDPTDSDFWRVWSSESAIGNRRALVQLTRKFYEPSEIRSTPKETVYQAMGSAILDNPGFNFPDDKKLK